MWLKYPALLLAFFILALLQHSFFVYFNLFGVTPDLLFILFFIIIFFEPAHDYSLGFFSVIVAGFFTDAFSPFHFGIAIACLLITYATFKITTKFFKETQEKYLFFYFIPRFLCFLVAYQLLFWLLTQASYSNFTFSDLIFINLAYNLAFAIFMCYLYKSFIIGYNQSRQLKLL